MKVKDLRERLAALSTKFDEVDVEVLVFDSGVVLQVEDLSLEGFAIDSRRRFWLVTE